MQTKDIAALIEQRSDRQQSSEETAAGAILKHAGGKRMSQEEFDISDTYPLMAKDTPLSLP
jgi:hypothetical protein